MTNDMIPYIDWHIIQLGPITLQVWGMFVATGFLFGGYMAARMAKMRGEDPKVIYDLGPWLILAGLIGGRLGDVLFYRPGFYLTHPAEIVMLWHGGASFFGGFIACVIVGVWYFRKKKLDVWKFADILAFGLPFGYALGRVGCFLIHDHPGTATDFFLGVKYPDGVVRHDLGLYHAIDGAILGLLFLWLSRKPRPVGTYLATFSVWYGVTRFFLDFLRTVDTKYFGLTPAQYMSVGLVAFGFWLFRRMWITHSSKNPQIQ
jgi:phosphatidylglycerol:prolipoprotein diacylglycerol transferase